VLRHEQELVAAGYITLAGIDEAGRGPLAGPVVAAAVILPWSYPIPGVRDSKTVRPHERERLYYEIVGRASAIGLGVVDVGDIDRINIFRATVKAMEQAVICLNGEPDAVLVDAVTLPGVAVPQLYVRDVLAAVVRPVKELKGFGRVALRAGESARVTFEVPTDMLCFTGPNGRRIVEPGEFELQVGASSADVRLRATVTLTGPVRELGGQWRMESRCTVGR